MFVTWRIIRPSWRCCKRPTVITKQAMEINSWTWSCRWWRLHVSITSIQRWKHRRTLANHIYRKRSKNKSNPKHKKCSFSGKIYMIKTKLSLNNLVFTWLFKKWVALTLLDYTVSCCPCQWCNWLVGTGVLKAMRRKSRNSF